MQNMPKISISIADLQLLSDASARCLNSDIEDYRIRLDFAFFKKKVSDLIGPQSPFAEVRMSLFQKYGTLSEDGQTYLFPQDTEKASLLVQGIDDASRAVVEVPFPELTLEKIEKAKLPMNPSELAVLVSLGILKEE